MQPIHGRAGSLRQQIGNLHKSGSLGAGPGGGSSEPELKGGYAYPRLAGKLSLGELAPAVGDYNRFPLRLSRALANSWSWHARIFAKKTGARLDGFANSDTFKVLPESKRAASSFR
jgi:hypothetical protein